MEGYLGEIRIFGGTYAPLNWAFCDGQTLSVENNTALYSIIGNIYGGTMYKTFNLPNIKGRMIIGAGPNFALGSVGGAIKTALTFDKLPPHTHANKTDPITAVIKTPATAGAPDTEFPKDAYPAEASQEAYDKAGNSLMQISPSAHVAEYTIPTDDAGGSNPIELYSPSLTVSHIICLSGSYPERG